MLFFGHLGIGRQIVRPLSRGLPLRWIYLGTVLPDLIDKPLYYLLSFATGKTGAALGLISNTRTFGHTGLTLLSVGGAAFARKSKPLAALALGIGSHLVLDAWSEEILTPDANQFLTIVLWPLIGNQFPSLPFKNIAEHFHFWQQPWAFYTEAVGVLFLSWDYIRTRSRSRLL